MVKSMTGFGRATSEEGKERIFSLEMKSVNHRYLDMNIRMPRSMVSLEEKIRNLSAADIFKELKKQNPAAMRGSNPNSFSQQLVPAGFLRKHGRYGNFYPVVSLT